MYIYLEMILRWVKHLRLMSIIGSRVLAILGLGCGSADDCSLRCANCLPARGCSTQQTAA